MIKCRTCVVEEVDWVDPQNFKIYIQNGYFSSKFWYSKNNYSFNLVLKQSVATLVLGLRPRQGVARLRAKRKTRESLHMPPGVQRVWGHEPSHSQVNSHVGSWSLERTFEFSERDCRGQNSSPWGILCNIEKILKCRCLKWVCISHLDIYNTSYGQKNGRKSNWQFDSRPLKVRNRPDFLACRQCAT
jgi:hypothetical protein